MTLLLVIATVVEILVVVVVLAKHLAALDRRLKQLAGRLSTIAFGVNAVQWQTGSIGPSVTRLNAALQDIAAALPPLVDKAEQVAGSRN